MGHACHACHVYRAYRAYRACNAYMRRRLRFDRFVHHGHPLLSTVSPGACPTPQQDDV